MKKARWLSSILVMAASLAAAQAPARGHLVLIGGGDKPADAMRRFVELAGGPSALIVAIPTASEEPDAGEYYLKLLRDDYGCSNVTVLDIKTREDALRADWAEVAGRARGIFFGGGDQSRITRALLDTPVFTGIASAYESGAVVGGTSAGTACQSALMITGEGDFKAITADNVELVRGLGFFRGVIVDQHFVARQRANRLISVILEHPELLGIGIDEDTAAWVRPDGTFQVLGQRCVVVVDPAGAKVSRQPREGGHAGLGVHGLTVDVLLPGEVYDLNLRTVVSPAGGGQ